MNRDQDCGRELAWNALGKEQKCFNAARRSADCEDVAVGPGATFPSDDNSRRCPTVPPDNDNNVAQQADVTLSGSRPAGILPRERPERFRWQTTTTQALNRNAGWMTPSLSQSVRRPAD